MTDDRTGSITATLADFAVNSRFDALPEHVRTEAIRAFVNWLGCALGGCREPAVMLAASMIDELGGKPQASVIGHRQRTDLASAAFLNCISSSNLAFDDTHLPTVTHPTSPVASALFAFAERQVVDGEAFLNALAVGIEITCRVSNALVMPPSNFNLGYYVTGLSGPIGVAAAIGTLLKLDAQKMRWALAIAAAQSSGLRAMHGTMASHFMPGNAARSGVWAALLAAKGYTASDHALEGQKGLFDVLAPGANTALAIEDLGIHYELLATAYKPYPSGIVIHPAIDACLEVEALLAPGAEIQAVTLRVHPLTIQLTDRRHPTTPLESNVSLYHWTAAVLLRGRASVTERSQDCIDDPRVRALRERISAIADAGLEPDEAIAELTLTDGSILRSHVPHARGSVARPMTDKDIDLKFRGQAMTILDDEAAERLLMLVRSVASLEDVGRSLTAVMEPALAR